MYCAWGAWGSLVSLLEVQQQEQQQQQERVPDGHGQSFRSWTWQKGCPDIKKRYGLLLLSQRRKNINILKPLFLCLAYITILQTMWTFFFLMFSFLVLLFIPNVKSRFVIFILQFMYPLYMYMWNCTNYSIRYQTVLKCLTSCEIDCISNNNIINISPSECACDHWL